MKDMQTIIQSSHQINQRDFKYFLVWWGGHIERYMSLNLNDEIVLIN